MNNTEIVVISLMLLFMFGSLFLSEKINANKIVAKVFIPASLLILWLYLIIFQSFVVENVFTVLSDSYSSTELTNLPSGEILSGQMISGEFTATENYLGVIGFRFWNFYRLNDDFLIFRIKEKEEVDWYYQNNYKSDQFQPNQYFTFGFPAIENSKGKHFTFEIESTVGKSGDAIGASTTNPIYIVKYKYPKSIVTKNTESFLNFCYKKLVNLLKNSNFTATSCVFLLPYLLYVIFISQVNLIRLRHISINKKKISVLLGLMGLLADTLYIRENEKSVIILISVFLYIFITYKIKYSYYFAIASGCLLTSGLLLYFGSPSGSERAGAWTWIFLFMWTVIQIWYLKRAK